ncbi:hypothetical protein CBS101457_004874 [Exobasidium rhododendri]|nr:hypothetical protein CBS101457_004874 [Exobasidium rhododendri]
MSLGLLKAAPTRVSPIRCVPVRLQRKANKRMATVLQALAGTESGWLVAGKDQLRDTALNGHRWGFATISAKHATFICVKSPKEADLKLVQHFRNVFKDALDDHHLIEKQTLAQSLAVEIGRQAQNETLLDTKAIGKSQRNLDEMGNVDLDANIFTNAAEYLRQILQADGCVIFDLAEFRLTHSSPVQTRSHASSGKEASQEKSSDVDMALDSTETALDSTDTAVDSIDSAIGSSEVSEIVSPLPSNTSSLLTSQSQLPHFKEHFIASQEGKTHCSYFSSPSPVRILGHAGRNSDHFRKLSGEVSKPIIGQYLSMTRTSGLNSKAYIETNSKREYGLSNLAPDESKTTICCSVAEADTQPAFFIFAYFTTEEVQFDRTEQLFIEQLGAYLIYSSIRSRVISVDRAQIRFTQRIQHELRTPLHAIIGVNEIARQSLNDTLKVDEMKEMIDSIGISADSLNLLVDDLVDFSLMERLSGESKLLQKVLTPSSWEDVCGAIMSSSLQALTLCQRINRAVRQSGPPPPEMIVVIEDLHKYDWTTFKAQIDLEIIRRVLWKLVLNAIQATSEGIISVVISYKPPQENPTDPPSVDRLQIKVKDTGRGMTQEFVDKRLFLPFGKEDEESGGVGLSLSICQQLVAQVSGRIFAESVLGKGTRMTVSIPLKNARKVKLSTSKQLEKPSIGFLGFETPSKRLFVREMLKQFDCQETTRLDVAPIIIVSVDSLNIQDDHIRTLQSLSISEKRTEIVLMPYSFLIEMDEERAKQLDDMSLLFEQQTHIFERPLSLVNIKEFSTLIESVKLRADTMMGSIKVSKDDILALGRIDSPLKQSLSETINTERRARRESPDLNENHPFTILVVEDNPLNARIMSTMLKRAKLEYYVATNGKEGVEMFGKYLPILVLLDINMPILNGFEACQEMRKIESPFKHKIVAITALSTEVEKRKGKDCGMDDWYTKPTRMSPLLQNIRKWRREYEGKAGSGPSTPSSSGISLENP